MKLFLLLLVFITLKDVFKCQQMFVRKNIKYFTFNDWQEFRRGMKIMKSRPEKSPLSYSYQVNIHGWSGYNGSEITNTIADHYNWHKCVHRQYTFLVWHRMYTYFFERILREATGNPHFTIPYWDYYDRHQRELPLPFRLPANEEINPLYVRARCDIINRGAPLAREIVDPIPALRSRFFAANKSNDLNVCHSIGGGRINSPAFVSDRQGLLESLPHNQLHSYIGGPTGYMSDLCVASRDPIFWPHHTTIDRVWESWIHLGGQNLMEEQYLKQTFKFFDERGNLGEYCVQDFLNITKLNYRYDSLVKAERVVPTKNETPKLFITVDETRDLVITTKKRSILLEIKQNYFSFFENIAKGRIDGNKIRFTLQMTLKVAQSRFLYNVYLNLPQNVIPNESSNSYIGYIVLFEAKCVRRPEINATGITNCFDITDNLLTIFRNEIQLKGVVLRYLNVTIVPIDCGSVYYSDNEENLIEFQRTYLTHYFPQAN